MTLTISNTGDVPLLVSELSSSSTEFVVSQASFTVDAGSDQEVRVTFTPSSAGGKTATLTIASDDPGSPSVTVSLVGSAVTSLAIQILPPSRIITPARTGYNDTLEVLFHADEAAQSQFSIYDLGGYMVYSADAGAVGFLPNSWFRYTWNGRADNDPGGEVAEDGLYIYLLIVNNEVNKGTFAIAR